MREITIIRDEDIGLDPKNSGKVTTTREAVRAILLDSDGKIGMIEATTGNYYKLPGGGVDEGESHEQALRRELIEEAGYEIEIKAELGYTIEYRCQWPKFPRSGLEQYSYCYVARAGTFVGAAPEEDEAADGFELVWLELDEAIKRLANVIPHTSAGSDEYDMQFYTLRERLILEAYKQSIRSNS